LDGHKFDLGTDLRAELYTWLRDQRQQHYIYSHSGPTALLAAEPAADATLCLCCFVFHSLVKLINGAVELFACFVAVFLCFCFSFRKFAFGVGGLAELEGEEVMREG
jgi:hypothetical protein